ncbi:MAG: glutaminyl-peptide cyclotransferase [Sandaracinus sp.]|nr:glutaminyl-peptide cyclotransferase [Sandaracinus sp.]
MPKASTKTRFESRFRFVAARKKRPNESRPDAKSESKSSKKKSDVRSTRAESPRAKRASAPPPAKGSSGTKWLYVGALGFFGVVAAVVVAQGGPESRGRRGATEEVTDVSPPRSSVQIPEALRVRVVERRPHDPDAFTQGLLWHDGELYESTGLEGESSLRRVDLTSGEVRQRVEVPEELFAEGLALVGDRLFQITWQNHKAFVYDRNTFEKVREHDYEGEGWGLCYDGTHLVMSDGSDRLFFRDPETFEVRRTVHVTKVGRPLRYLNELECVNGKVWANVWQRDEIVRIDPQSGVVEATVDASGLLTREERRRTDVLNGIAWLPDRERFLITGKLWPWTFEVELVER